MAGPLLGAHFATGLASDGFPASLGLFERSGFRGAKFMMPANFSTTPDDVRRCIDLGADEIILRTADSIYTPQSVSDDLVGRGFWQLIQENPTTRFIIEVGNEQDRGHGGYPPLDPWEGRYWQLRTRHDLQHLTSHNVRWIASMPTTLPELNIYLSRTEEVFASGQVWLPDYYDGFGAHVYGHYQLEPESIEDGSSEWNQMIDVLLARTGLPVYITEFGINHAFDDPHEKGRRYLRWLSGIDGVDIPSAYVYWLGTGERDPQYQVTEEIGAQLVRYHGSKEPERPTGTQRQAIEQLQGWAKHIDASFVPIRIED